MGVYLRDSFKQITCAYLGFSTLLLGGPIGVYLWDIANRSPSAAKDIVGGIGLVWFVGSLLLAALPVQRSRRGDYSRKEFLIGLYGKRQGRLGPAQTTALRET